MRTIKQIAVAHHTGNGVTQVLALDTESHVWIYDTALQTWHPLPNLPDDHPELTR